jgi:membrane protease YdiL (CAAX protease family)
VGRLREPPPAWRATWVVGAFTSGPLHLGHLQTRDDELRRPVLIPVLTGVVAFGVFYGCALVVRQIPVLDRAISSVLTYADEGDDRLVLLTTLANGAAEEVFFRGALYAAIGQEHPSRSARLPTRWRPSPRATRPWCWPPPSWERCSPRSGAPPAASRRPP